MKYHAPYGSTDPNASYVDKDVPGAVRGSAVPAAAIETPQREIVDFILKSGMEPANELQLAHAVQSGKVNYAVAGGTATAFTAALSLAPETYADIVGAPIRINIAVVSGVAPTLNLNGLGNRPIVSQDGYPLIGGEMQGITELIYDGTAFRAVGVRRSRSFVMSGITQSLPAGAVVLTNYSSKALALPASTESFGSITIGAADAGVYVLNTFLACSPSVNNLTTFIQVNGVRVGVNASTEAGNAEATSTSAVLRLNDGDVVRHCGYTPAGGAIVNGRFSGCRLSI
ncbi:hypothetical protein [Agrobacterium tumefaciens]|uniref:hypothetical protein n=1 Tax=Agrobacterium tumefaciens TaxID=358 RepID=UPI00045ADDEC|nr:hypothetical protein [Agrobacterium tumefaciens]CDN94808.1 Phage-related tail fiber protein-like protein [Agrobacterium tumefaciens]